MALPTDFPNWANLATYLTGPDVGTATKVAPTTGEINEGFVPDTASVPQYFNYLFQNIKAHIAYLRAIGGEALTWTGVQTFNTAPVLSSAVDMTYSTAKSFTVYRKPNATGTGVFGSPADVSFTGGLSTFIVAGSSSTGTHSIPVEIPLGATLTGWEVLGLHNAFSESLATGHVSFYEQPIDFATTSFSAGSLITTQSITGNNVAYKKTWTGTKLNDGSKLYFIDWTTDGVAGGSNAVSSSLIALKLTYTDPKAIGSRQ